MGKLLKLTAVLLVACLLFTFFPSSASTDQIIAVQSSLRTQGNVASSWQVAMEMRDSNEDYASQGIREDIVAFATTVALRYGNGYVKGNDYTHATKIGKNISYLNPDSTCPYASCDEPTYGTSKYNCSKPYVEAEERFAKMLKGEYSHVNFYCWAASTFIWGAIVPELRGGHHDGNYLWQNTWVEVPKDDHDLLFATAKPGDIIAYANVAPTWDSATGKGTAPGHANMYIGEWTSPEGIHFEHAVCNTGWVDSYNDWVIKEYYENKDNSKVFIIPLDKVLEEANVYEDKSVIDGVAGEVLSVATPPGEIGG